MTTKHEQIWREATKQLAAKLNRELYQRWIEPLVAVSSDEDELRLQVPNEFSRIWLEENFLCLLRDAVAQAAGRPFAVRLQVAASGTARTRSSAPAGGSSRSEGGCGLELNPRYTFETFVVGPNNSFAHAAALAVAQSPARAYNPLFIYGGVGLGKTHLMQAIGHCVAKSGRHRKVCYVTCETFTNDFIHAIGTRSLAKFRRKYRQPDLLLIDDIHFLAGKEQTQEEFFHTFNTLFDAHRQIVLSSDRPAAEIANLEQRLVSRFEWGLVTELQPPALETRLAILRSKAAQLTVKVPDSVLTFIAENIRSNVRRLEGALIRVASYLSLTGKELTQEALESLLRDALHEESKRVVTIEAIQRKVAEHFDLRLADMTSRRRPQNVAFPRQVAMYLSRRLTGRSLVDIGEAFGGRDHGTVIHACQLVEQRMARDEQLRQTVAYLQSALLR